MMFSLNLPIKIDTGQIAKVISVYLINQKNNI